MVDERDRRKSPHLDHSGDRLRNRHTPIAIPIQPPDETGFEDGSQLTPVEQLIDRISTRTGGAMTPSLRLIVEELLAHDAHVEERSASRIRRSTDKILASHQEVLRGGPPPTRTQRFISTAKWLGTLLVAVVTAIYTFGVNRGRSECETDRRQLEQLQITVRQLEFEQRLKTPAPRAPTEPE